MFREPQRHGHTQPRKTVLAALEAGVRAADPELAAHRKISHKPPTLRVNGTAFDLSDYETVLLAGGGKAAAGVTRGIVAALEPKVPTTGTVVVPSSETGECDGIDLVEGGHPVPSDRGIRHTRRLLDKLRAADERTLVLAPITGGGSALLAAPVAEVPPDALRAVTERLLAAGAPIDEVNTVRRHISAVKGGRLAVAAAPARVVGLLVSDVVGDDPAVIASGPTAPDPTTAGDALGVLDRYDIAVPTINQYLEKIRAGDRSETPTRRHPAFSRVHNELLSGAGTAIHAAAEAAESNGASPHVVTRKLQGPADTRGRTVARLAGTIRVCGAGSTALVSAGETTVQVTGDGTGGPNLSFALSAALELSESACDDRIAVGAIDTDGHDGSTAAAGGLVDGTTVDDPAAARDALARDDAFTYLDDRGAVLTTGRTGTNVNDLHVAVTPENGDR